MDRLPGLLVGRLKSAQPGEEGRLLHNLSETQEETHRRSWKRVGRARMFQEMVGRLKDMRCCGLVK